MADLPTSDNAGIFEFQVWKRTRLSSTKIWTCRWKDENIAG
jgi:hypothetical protein